MKQALMLIAIGAVMLVGAKAALTLVGEVVVNSHSTQQDLRAR